MRKQLNASLKMKQSAVSSASNEGKALALMMVDTELRLTRGVLANLEEQLVIGLENKREQMQNKIAENNQQQIETNMRLGKLRVESENLLETRAITEPIRSINAVGVSKLIVVVVLLFTGVFLGIFLVFFAEFLAKVRKHQLEL